MKKALITITFVFLYFFLMLKAHAERYIFDNVTGDTVIGEIKIVNADERETLLDIARNHGFGYQDMKLINDGVDTWLPEDGQEIILPAELFFQEVILPGKLSSIFPWRAPVRARIPIYS